MKFLMKCLTYLLVCLVSLTWPIVQNVSNAADHNDPNAVNSIFSDIAIQAADLYGMFGYPSDDKSDGEKVVVQLTFASIPETGVFDRDILYTINIDPDPRISTSLGDGGLDGVLDYVKSVKDKYFKQQAYQIKVTFNDDNQAQVNFLGFPGGDFTRVVDTNDVLTIESPGGHAIETFIGGRDDPFFNDLPGFFRSINYGPQFYNIPITMAENREFEIPKTLLELEGNTLFNYNPGIPRHGSGVKLEMPEGPHTWNGDRFLKDENGNFRFVYSGTDAQAGFNVNAIVFEIPLAFLTESPETDRIVRVWGESWVLKASGKVKHTVDRESYWYKIKGWFATMFSSSNTDFNDNIYDYKLVDHVGVPFSDAGLSEREDKKVGANNIKYGRDFVRRFAHLGWGFGPSIKAVGLGTCFDCDDVTVSVHKTYKLATTAFPRVKKCLFQTLNMPDDSWNTSGKDIPLKKVFEITVPNVTSIDMDTNGTWPFGRRLEDQVASRFLSVFLDMEGGCGGGPCDVETLQNQALWDGAPIEPKTPPNPLKNDKPFLDHFPYLAEPWPVQSPSDYSTKPGE